MAATKPPDTDGNGKSVALWAALTTFFANLAAINLLSLVGDETHLAWKALAAFITAVVVALSVYSKHRWDDAKERKERTVGTTYQKPNPSE